MPDNEVESSRFDVPKSPKKYIYEIDKFLGADFTSSPSEVDVNHSPNCVNFIRMMPGKIKKRVGYAPVAKGTGKVFSIWKWDNNNYVIHIGDTMYHIGRKTSGELDFSVIDGADTAYSQVIKTPDEDPFEAEEEKYSYIRSGDLGLIFGHGIYFYDGAEHIYDVGEIDCTVPIVTISKKPKGGGTSYQPFNLINTKFTEAFYVSQDDNAETEFHMSYSDLDSVDKVEVMQQDGTMSTLAEGAGYTVDLENGIINIDPAPGKSPAEGEDNVFITAQKTFEGYNDRISKCTFAIAYGISGNYDRVFVSGNPDYPNFDWFSEKDDPTYFPDTNYSVLGSDASPISGYAIVSNSLVTLKGSGSDRQTAIIRQGTLDSDNNAVFAVKNSLQGFPVLSPDSSVMAGIEPMFLTEEGIMAITSADLSGEKIMNSRSYFLNGKLLKEPGLEKSFAIRHNDYYMLFVNSHVYILDTLQIITSEAQPYSSRQYATFYWDNVPALCAASIDDTIYFGTDDGNVMEFAKDDSLLNSYSDNGAAIRCIYETADIDALIFFKNKTYRFLAVRAFPAIVSSLKIWVLKQGIWDLVKYDTGTIRYFTFSHLKFSELTFKTDTGTQLVSSKLRVKKVDHVRFKLENERNYEPLMIDQFGIEYTQSGNHKS